MLPADARGDDGLPAASSLPAASQPGAEADRLAWFREAKFGMFIHWGIYAVPAGKWGDRTDLGEWFQLEVGLSNSEYEKYAAAFNPVKFDAAQWADVARRAGMKYMVATTKHQDGFCMFDSRHTNYDIVDATPFRRDPMKELADAVRAAGLKMGFYYSLTDWHHPEVPAKLMQTSHGARSLKKFRDGFHGNPNPDADIRKYNGYMRDQLAELLSNYGPISVLWFDAGGAFKNVDRPAVLEADAIVSLIRKLQPECLINNRLGAGRDYGTPEQKIPDTTLPEPFEVCMTLNGHWGFNAADQKWKPASDVIRKLAEIASKGGNFLLNVGPTATGEFPPEAVRILEGVGNWMDVNGESIYGTTASPLDAIPAWGVVTARPDRLYLHVLKWPNDGKLKLKHDVRPTKARLLADGSDCAVTFDAGEVVVSLPDKAPDQVDSVIVIECAMP